MNVSTRLGGGYLLLILVFGGLLLFYQRTVQQTIEVGRGIATIDSRVLLVSTDLLDLLGQSGADAAKYRVTTDPGYLDAFHIRRGAIRDSIEALEQLPLRGGQREAVQRLVESWDDIERRFELAGEGASGTFLSEASETDWTEFEAASIDLEQRVRDVRSVSRAVVTQDLGNLAAGAERAADAAVLGLAIAVALAGVLALWILRSIARPIARLEDGAAAVAGGDFAVRIGVHGPDELARLARSFDRMTEQLGEIESTKRDFLSKMSHDLKTPLASIREVKRLLLDEVPGDLTAKQRRMIELGLANADRLTAMIERLLEVSRLEAGVEQYELERLDLGELCETTVERWMAGSRKSTVRFQKPDGPLWINADRFALQRVLENLLENAEVHGEGKPIEVVVAFDDNQSDGPLAIVSVIDRGPGIPPGEREHIFETFARGDRAEPGAGHVGLGLAICREIVTRHGGGIRLDGTHEESHGAVFTFWLPARV